MVCHVPSFHHGTFTWARIGSIFLALVPILIVNAYAADASVVYSTPSSFRYESLSSLLKTDSSPACSLATLSGAASAGAAASQQGCNWSNNESQDAITSIPSSPSVQYVTFDADPAHSSASASLLRHLQSQDVPFVIRGNWSEVTLARVRNLWTDEHLSAQFGSRTMRAAQLKHQAVYNPQGVQLNKQPLNWTSFTYARDEAVGAFQRGKRAYAYLHASSRDSPFLAQDLSDLFSAPSPLVDETSDPAFRRSPFANLQCRFSTPGLQAHAHVDSTDNFLALVAGSKEYILLPPSECATLQIPGSGARARHSQLDWNDPLVLQSEAFQSARAVRVTLHAGEILYMPAYWIHHISSRGSSSAIQCNQRNKRSQRGLQDLHQCDAGFQERYQTVKHLTSPKKQEQCAVWPDVASLFAIRSECNGQALCSDDGNSGCSTIGITTFPSTATAGDTTIVLTLTSTTAATAALVAKFNMDCIPASGTGSARTVFTLPPTSTSTTATFNVPAAANTWTCTFSLDSSSTDTAFTNCGPIFQTYHVAVSCPTASLTLPSHVFLVSGANFLVINTSPVNPTKSAIFNLVCSPVGTGTVATTAFTVGSGSNIGFQFLNIVNTGSYSCALSVDNSLTTDSAFLSTTCPAILSPTSASVSATCPSAVVTGLPSSLVVGAPPITLTVSLDYQLGSGTVTFNLACTPTGGSTPTNTLIPVNSGGSSGSATFNPPPGSGTFTCALSIVSTSDPNYAPNAPCPPVLTVSLPFNFPVTLPSTIYVFGTKLN